MGDYGLPVVNQGLTGRHHCAKHTSDLSSYKWMVNGAEIMGWLGVPPPTGSNFRCQGSDTCVRLRFIEL